jgi:hypothetical protein
MNQNSYNGAYTSRSNREDLPYKRPRFNNTRSASPSPFRGSDNRPPPRRQDSDHHSPSPYTDRSRGYENRNSGYQRRYENNFQDKSYSRPQNNQYSSPSYCQQYNNSKPNNYQSRSHQARTRTEFPDQLLFEYGFLASPQRSQAPNRFSQLLDPTIGKNEVDDILANITST